MAKTRGVASIFGLPTFVGGKTPEPLGRGYVKVYLRFAPEELRPFIPNE